MAQLDLDLNEQQALLLGAVQRLVSDIEEPSWNDLAQQIGLAGLTLPESCGGFGGGIADIALVMAELGPALAGADWLPHAVACLTLSESDAGHPLLPALADGSTRAALICDSATARKSVRLSDGKLSGHAGLVCGGAGADQFLLSDDGALLLFAAGAPGLTITPRPMHDGSMAADLALSDVAAERIHLRGTHASLLVEAGRCAEAVGLMQRLMTDTADYLVQRRQFGVPISSFQVLRHRLADMQLAAMQAQALVEQAILALDRETGDKAIHLSAACLAVRDAARTVGEGAVQLHGAMGLTEELRLGARFKRLLAIAAGLGSEARLIERNRVAV